MVEAEMVKVYELAKELGIDSISLLDKLNGLNIKVKNHMSELKPEEVSLARTSLTPKKEATSKKTASASGVKSTRTRKAAAPAQDTIHAGATLAGAAKPATRSKAPAPAEPVAAGASMTPPSSAAKSAAPVIRRRTSQDGQTETLMPSNLGSKNVAAADASAQEAAAGYSETTSEEEVHEAQPVTEAQESAAEIAPAAESSEAPAAVSQESMQTPAAPQAPTRAPVVLSPRPVAPRKSFLTIVEAKAPPARPVIKPAPIASPQKTNVKGVATTDKDGFRVIKMTKENLDAMVEEENTKKKGGGGREAEIRPEDVRFADYRKKEMVFLPKRKRLPVGKEIKKTVKTTPKAIKRVVEMGSHITVQDLASQLQAKANEVIRKLMGMGMMVNINASIDFDTASIIAAEYQYEVKNTSFKEEEFIEASVDAEEHLVPRPPVVTVMGHVDHGKTSLLDAIRQADVAAGEAGGITQHIGAYTVNHDGKLITFIDTPGHEAFTSMRSRGANATDIVILVVAADDGVMPQTREALSHAKAAGVPIIVAVNKMDKPGAQPDKVKQALAELDLLAEDWGGQTMFVPVSAIKKQGIDKLLEAILLQSEVLELKANPDTLATGTVLEARVERGRGPMASVLVRRGTLRIGDPIVSGTAAGRVKAMMDDKGRSVKEVTPGMSAEVLGFEITPSAGEKFDVPNDEAAAREIAQHRLNQTKVQSAANKASLDDLFSKIQAGAIKELNIILKADVFGSVEAIRDSLTKLSTEKVKVKVIYAQPGGISESDVLLASASSAVIIGFNVRPETKARQTAEAAHVEIKTYSIIYELIDDIKNSMVGLLDKKKVEKFLGRAEIRQIFSVPKIGTIGGASVVDGKIVRGANVRLLRDSRIVYEGKMSSLRRFKDDAKEVAEGFECGIGLESYNDLKPGDIVEAYQIDLVTPDVGTQISESKKA